MLFSFICYWNISHQLGYNGPTRFLPNWPDIIQVSVPTSFSHFQQGHHSSAPIFLLLKLNCLKQYSKTSHARPPWGFHPWTLHQGLPSSDHHCLNLDWSQNIFVVLPCFWIASLTEGRTIYFTCQLPVPFSAVTIMPSSTKLSPSTFGLRILQLLEGSSQSGCSTLLWISHFHYSLHKAGWSFTILLHFLSIIKLWIFF